MRKLTPDDHNCVETERLRRLEDHILTVKEDIAYIKGRMQQKDNSGVMISTIVSTIVASLIGLIKP